MPIIILIGKHDSPMASVCSISRVCTADESQKPPSLYCSRIVLERDTFRYVCSCESYWSLRGLVVSSARNSIIMCMVFHPGQMIRAGSPTICRFHPLIIVMPMAWYRSPMTSQLSKILLISSISASLSSTAPPFSATRSDVVAPGIGII